MRPQFVLTIATVVFSLSLAIPEAALGQDRIAWSSDYQLSADDFRGTAPNTGTIQTVYGHSIVEYGFVNYQLLFSNLNSNVTCSFLPSASWLDEGDATDILLAYAQTTWDLNELAARKLRKLFHENRMSMNANKMNEYYSQVASEITELQSQYTKETNYGSIEEQQLAWERKVAGLLAEYGNYCQECKPPKRKKKRK